MRINLFWVLVVMSVMVAGLRAGCNGDICLPPECEVGNR